jgi:hypothetical protein
MDEEMPIADFSIKPKSNIVPCKIEKRTVSKL